MIVPLVVPMEVVWWCSTKTDNQAATQLHWFQACALLIPAIPHRRITTATPGTTRVNPFILIKIL